MPTPILAEPSWEQSLRQGVFSAEVTFMPTAAGLRPEQRCDPQFLASMGALISEAGHYSKVATEGGISIL